MGANHTPGPWMIRYSGEYPYQIVAPNGSEGPGGILAVTRWNGITMPSSDEGKANARLIAAAPALLKVLASIIDGIEDERGPDDGVDGVVLLPLYESQIAEARAAIASALGEG